MDLFDYIPERNPTIEDRFAEFHANHPDVYELFKAFAVELLQSGHNRGSADAICHRIRWHSLTSGKDASGFKINDHYTALYGRMLAAEDPERFGEFFEFRMRRTAVDV